MFSKNYLELRKRSKVLEYMSFYMYIRTYVSYRNTIIWSLKRSIKNFNVSLMACQTVTVNGKKGLIGIK